MEEGLKTLTEAEVDALIVKLQALKHGFVTAREEAWRAKYPVVWCVKDWRPDTRTALGCFSSQAKAKENLPDAYDNGNGWKIKYVVEACASINYSYDMFLSTMDGPLIQ